MSSRRNLIALAAGAALAVPLILLGWELMWAAAERKAYTQRFDGEDRP